MIFKQIYLTHTWDLVLALRILNTNVVEPVKVPSTGQLDLFNHLQRIISSVMVIVVGIGHDDTSSNPGRDWLHFI